MLIIWSTNLHYRIVEVVTLVPGWLASEYFPSPCTFVLELGLSLRLYMERSLFTCQKERVYSDEKVKDLLEGVRLDIIQTYD